MKSLDISVIYTFHDEGVVIYKTFLALRRMLKWLDDGGITYEVIAHLDNGDEKTRSCLKRVKREFNLRIIENSFGEPSRSRNYAVNQANGNYVCLMDGDDLFSEKWLLDAFNLMKDSNEDVILHPECNLTFGLDEQPRFWRMKDSFDLDTDLLILFGRNRWCSGTFLKRDLAKKHPYKKVTGCYGFEDWHYNCDTRADNIRHNVVPGSVLFYRVRKGSTYSRHTGENTTIPYTKAFCLENMKRLYRKDFEKHPEATPPDSNRSLRVLRAGHKLVRRIPFLKLADRKITSSVERYRMEQSRKKLPPFLLKEWRKMNEIDSQLYPDKEIVSRMPIYGSELDYLGKAYCRMVHTLKKDPDYVFMPPVMSIGGTEKVLENYMRAIYEIHPEWCVVVCGRLPDGHPYTIPPNVTFIDIDEISSHLSDWDKGFLITKFVVQTKVKYLHIIGNDFYYRWAINNKELIKTNGIKLNCSFFMHEFSEDEKRIQSFADPYYVELEPIINKVFTDNKVIADDLIDRTGLSVDEVSVHYQPIDLRLNKYKSGVSNKSYSVLWASRIAPQKRPDILKKIAECLPEGYSLDVYGRIQKPYYRDDYFAGAKGINYKGAFSSIKELPIEKYDAYLYTAQTDGIPNILLEITALGLPIVATREGGVPDFLNNGKNGELVELHDIGGYIRGLRNVIETKKGAEYVRNAQKLLRKRHSWEEFVETVRRDLN